MAGGKQKKKNKETKKLLSKVEAGFREYSSRNDHCFTISYADVVGKTKVLKDLYDFIGAEYNEKRIDDVLAKPHSYGQSKSILNKLAPMLKKA